MAPQTVIQITASTHFNITLTTDNFSSWLKYVQSPAEFLDADRTKSNPDFSTWYRQDQRS
ncbi:hypothetical protein HanRHA438_Chr09g0409331 [Helianthus annuus]|nr:hypothetical protein HanRHA438_Chr09g0409331 [Helianthus annuus]